MFGLPGAGKSTAIETISQYKPYALVSADELRESHPDYDPEHPDAIHEECVKQAEQQMYYCCEHDMNVIMDGGGINNSYTLRIINKMKEFGYKISVVFVNTPTHICVQRNIDRKNKGKRFVPIQSILDKAYMLRGCVEKLTKIADEFVEIKYFQDDVIFVDMDGTVAEYYRLTKNLDGDIDFVNYDVFKYSKPVWEVIDKLRILESEGKRICILSASPNSLCNADKIDWIKEYMPFVKENDIYFCGNKQYKYVFLQQLMHRLKLNSNQVMVIDDDHNVLETYEPLNVNAVHPSYFLTNY